MIAFVVGVPGVVAGEVAPLLAAVALVLVAASLATVELPELAGWLALPPDAAVLAAAAVLFIVGIVWCVAIRTL